MRVDLSDQVWPAHLTGFAADLARYDYKPGCHVALTRADQGLDVSLFVPILRTATWERSEVVLSECVPENLADVNAGAVLLRLIDRAERHERDEWFKHDGIHVTDPHPQPRSPH